MITWRLNVDHKAKESFFLHVLLISETIITVKISQQVTNNYAQKAHFALLHFLSRILWNVKRVKHDKNVLVRVRNLSECRNAEAFG